MDYSSEIADSLSAAIFGFFYALGGHRSASHGVETAHRADGHSGGVGAGLGKLPRGSQDPRLVGALERNREGDDMENSAEDFAAGRVQRLNPGLVGEGAPLN